MGTSKSTTVQSKSKELTVMVVSDANLGRVVDPENSKQVEMKPSLNFNGMVAELKGPSCMHDTTGSLVLSMEEDSCQLGEEVNVECDKLFSPGWSSKSMGKKANKASGLGVVSKAQQLTRSPTRESMNVGNQKLVLGWMLGTRWSLGMWRGIQLNVCCEECKEDVEFVGHLLWSCSRVKEVWQCTKLKFQFDQTRVKSFHNLLWQVLMIDSSMEEDGELVVIVAWALWSNRNEVRHGGRKKSAVALFQWSRQYLQEFQEASQMVPSTVMPRVAGWSPSPSMRYKVNVDGAVIAIQVLYGEPIELGPKQWSVEFRQPLTTIETMGERNDGVYRFQICTNLVLVWELPFDLINEDIGKDVGGGIGRVLEVDCKAIVVDQARFLRIQVELPLDKPIQRGAPMLSLEGVKVQIAFQYE
nr:hypothetical protein CFP56_74328 [Quercus suber]